MVKDLLIANASCGRGASKCSVSRQQGVTLIEVMIALLVLSIGLLGVAAMQLKALQSSSHSYQRTLATLAAQDAVERLWALRIKDGGCVSDSDIYDGWVDDWGSVLPGVGASSIEGDGCQYTVTIAWDEERFDGAEGEVSNLVYVVKLPEGS
jgi:type IV pilus assembly protein PilV